jgi:hypothetical protein
LVVDRQELEVGGSPEAVSAYDRALDHLVRFQIEVIDETKASIAADPGFMMGRVLSAYLSLLSTEGASVARARDAITAAAEPLSPREQAHLEVVERWVAGDMLGAGRQLDELSLQFPQDLLALAVGHQIDFLTGNAANLRDRIARALGRWDPADPRYGYLLGMYAFGLEECNLYGLSEEAGRRAVEAHADDVWGIHAVVHTYEMQGLIPDGVRFMRQREKDWATGNFLNVHNSWHFALYLLQAGDTDGALGVYDRILHHDESSDVALELVDATSLLWRLFLERVPVGSRWQPLAHAWGRTLTPGFYPFNDMHAVMAFIGAGELDRAREEIEALEQFVDNADRSTTAWAMTSAVGLPVCRSLLRFAQGDFATTVDLLWPGRQRLHEFGGSHAQRDAVERTLLEAAIRAGRIDLAVALVDERLGVRDRSSYSWAKRAQVLADQSAAARAAGLAGEIGAALRSGA